MEGQGFPSIFLRRKKVSFLLSFNKRKRSISLLLSFLSLSLFSSALLTDGLVHRKQLDKKEETIDIHCHSFSPTSKTNKKKEKAKPSPISICIHSKTILKSKTTDNQRLPLNVTTIYVYVPVLFLSRTSEKPAPA